MTETKQRRRRTLCAILAQIYCNCFKALILFTLINLCFTTIRVHSDRGKAELKVSSIAVQKQSLCVERRHEMKFHLVVLECWWRSRESDNIEIKPRGKSCENLKIKCVKSLICQSKFNCKLEVKLNANFLLLHRWPISHYDKRRKLKYLSDVFEALAWKRL